MWTRYFQLESNERTEENFVIFAWTESMIVFLLFCREMRMAMFEIVGEALNMVGELLMEVMVLLSLETRIVLYW
jgi:hypothetical protein